MSMITTKQVQSLIDEKIGFGQDEFSKPALALLNGDACHLVSQEDVFSIISTFIYRAYQSEHGRKPQSAGEMQTIIRSNIPQSSDSKRYHLIDIVAMLDDPHVVHELRGRLPERTTKLFGHTMASIAAHYYTQNDPDLTIQGLIEKKTEAELEFTIRYESESALLAKLTVITNELKKRQTQNN